MIMPGRAEAALQRVLLVEGPLHRVQRAVRAGQALDRGDLAAVGLDGQHRAALHAALAAVGSDIRTVQAPQLLVSQPTTVPTLPSRSRR